MIYKMIKSEIKLGRRLYIDSKFDDIHKYYDFVQVARDVFRS